MLNLFDLNPVASLPLMQAQYWDYARTGLHANLEKVRRYYRNAPMAVRSDHFIIRLLQSISIPKSLATVRYYDNVDGLFSLNLSMALRMTSSISQGHLFKNTFYGGCDEILIAHTQSFDPSKAHERWEDLAAVRVLRHPKSDLNLDLPDGKVTSEEDGLAVIAINIPLLAIQYRAWRMREQEMTNRYGDDPHSIMQFVHMYVLPNMLPSHLDYALFNRINNLYKAAPMGESHRKHPFYLTDFTLRVNNAQTTMLGNLARVTRDFVGILHNIPAVTARDMGIVMKLPGMAPTKQVLWALMVTRLPALDFLTNVSLRGGFTKNGQEVNRIRQAFRSLTGNATMANVLPPAVEEVVYEEIDAIKERLI